MNKEKPKLSRSASTVYAFDLFSTIFQSKSRSFFAHLFNYKLLFNPNMLGIRWMIVTSAPKILLPFIKLNCFLNGLTPVMVVTSPYWFKKIDSKKYILNILLDINNGSFPIYVKSDLIRRVSYISNNIELCKFINNNINRLHNNVLAQSVIDFWHQKFESVL